MKNIDYIKHVRGESQFVDDVLTPDSLLHGCVYYSPIAHGKILNIDLSEALISGGIKAIFTAKDIPGENQIGGIIYDENLFAENEVHFVGHPIAFVVAETQLRAKEASQKIKCEFDELKPIFDPREAFKNGQLIIPPKIFSLGSVDDAWAKCDYIVEGTVESGGQEHIYLETQGAFSYPIETGGIKIISATQNPTAVQRTAARVLGISMHKVEVDVLRLGGAFGGKEDQATAWAVMTALAARKLSRPVKLILSRQDDIRLTGKRHPYSSDFKIGLNSDGKIIAYEVNFYQNAGAAADLSPAILERTLFHCTNSYYISNVKATAYSCKTNLPPFTAFRGFGAPQGMFVIESAIYKAAQVMGVNPLEIQKKNLLTEGDEFPYGQKAENCRAKKCYEEVLKKYQIESVKNKIDEFNTRGKFIKKGSALMPVCFGISFTSSFLNQASALVHVYIDGSVSVSTAAVEMGQGVNAKLHTIAAKVFSIDPKRVKVESTNTSRIANTSPTAASKAADLNGFAAMEACNLILKRLQKSAAEELRLSDESKISIQDEFVFYDNKKTDLSWERLVHATYMKRMSLSAHAHHATPGVFFDREKSKGNPFAYHVYGTALVEVTLDCLRGIYEIDSVKVVHDFGESLNPVIDRGQAEGAIAQGVGWMTCEELIWNDKGKLLTDTLSTYKVPDIHGAPKDIQIHFLEDAPNLFGPFKSKAIGEPPFMYGIGAFFALMNAMRSFKPNIDIEFKSPLTPERVLLSLCKNRKKIPKRVLETQNSL
jgi:xanthine dehydrogenase large subunit